MNMSERRRSSSLALGKGSPGSLKAGGEGGEDFSLSKEANAPIYLKLGRGAGRNRDHHLGQGAIKAQDRLTLTSTSKIEARKKEPLLLARAGLSSYLYRLCIMCVNLSMLGVVSTPPHWRGVAACVDPTTTAIRLLEHDEVLSSCGTSYFLSEGSLVLSPQPQMRSPSSPLAPTRLPLRRAAGRSYSCCCSRSERVVTSGIPRPWLAVADGGTSVLSSTR
jgi:hypothetical protein